MSSGWCNFPGCDCVKMEVRRPRGAGRHAGRRRGRRDGPPGTATPVGRAPGRLPHAGPYGRGRRTARLGPPGRMQYAGAAAILLEAVPAEVAQAVVEATTCRLSAAGPGPACHGHVFVTHDGLGLTERPPRFVPELGDVATPMIGVLRRIRPPSDGPASIPRPEHQLRHAGRRVGEIHAATTGFRCNVLRSRSFFPLPRTWRGAGSFSPTFVSARQSLHTIHQETIHETFAIERWPPLVLAGRRVAGGFFGGGGTAGARPVRPGQQQVEATREQLNKAEDLATVFRARRQGRRALGREHQRPQDRQGAPPTCRSTTTAPQVLPRRTATSRPAEDTPDGGGGGDGGPTTADASRSAPAAASSWKSTARPPTS